MKYYIFLRDCKNNYLKFIKVSKANLFSEANLPFLEAISSYPFQSS
jgi:hypothetical protein